jgi:CelD/BcsL family acetyltransferase involved in cellulose biosynthesis
LRLLLLKQIPEDADLRRQWNELVGRTVQPQVFYTYEWALTVQRAYSETLHPLLFLAYDERDSLCGLVALARTDGEQVSFLCATTGDYCDFISPPENKRDFVSSVLAELRKQGTSKIVLTNLPDDSDTVPALRQASSQIGLHCFARTAYVCAQISLAKIERRPKDNRLELPRRKMVRRFMNAMGHESPVRLDHARSWEQVQPALPEFIQAHVARFLATGRISNLARPERRTFLEELAKLLSETGWLAFSRLMSGKNSLAWNYGFQFGDTWFWYQPTFDSDLEKYSPGFCTLSKLIEEAATTGAFAIVDLGLGDEGYKERFVNETRRTLYVTLKQSRTQHYREIVRYRASELVRTSATVEKALRAAMQRWSTVSAHIAKDGARNALLWMAGRLRQLLWLESEVLFYEWCGSATGESGVAELRPLSLHELASATIQYVDDRSTLDYLLRAASRIQEGTAEGYGLVDSEGKFLHFAWATNFDGFFLSELNSKVDAPSSDCVMLYDCWTPSKARGHGYYGQTIARIAKLVRERGKRPWIFSANSNLSSIHGVEKAGFQRRYSLVRRRILGWQRIDGQTPVSRVTVSEEVSARL